MSRRAAQPEAKIVYAKRDASLLVGEHGYSVWIRFGEAWDGNDELVQKYPADFSDFPPVKTSRQGWVFLDD